MNHNTAPNPSQAKQEKDQLKPIFSSLSSKEINHKLADNHETKLKVLNALIGQVSKMPLYCYPSQCRLADEIGVERSTVSKYLQQWSDEGYVYIQHNGWKKNNAYVITPALYDGSRRAYFSRFLPSLRKISYQIFLNLILLLPAAKEQFTLLYKDLLILINISINSRCSNQVSLSYTAIKKGEPMTNSEKTINELKSIKPGPEDRAKLMAFPPSILEKADRTVMLRADQINNKLSYFLSTCINESRLQGIADRIPSICPGTELSSPEPSAEQSILQSISHLKSPKTNGNYKSPYNPYKIQKSFNSVDPCSRFKTAPKPDMYGNYSGRQREKYLEGLVWSKKLGAMVTIESLSEEERKIDRINYSEIVGTGKLTEEGIKMLKREGRLEEFMKQITE